MKKLLYLLIVIASTLFITKPAQATHMMGSDITWRCMGKDSFMITLVIYRDCNGVQLGSASIPIKCKKNGSSITTVSISKPAPVDITPTCGSSCTRCESSGCSFPYGIEQYSFKKLVVLSSAGSCCELVMSYQMCCRNTTITTGAASQNFYIEAIMNRCQKPCDNSPTFTNPPIAIICIGQDFMFNHGVNDSDVDTVNGGLLDSLGYEWAYPLSGSGSNIPYTGQYDYDKPVFFWGFPNTKLPFPRGFHLDQSTGDISFRPMKIEQTVMALTIKEYRKGKFIGQVRRDIQIIVINCPNNHAPVLSGPFYKEVCAGSTVTFSISTNDYDPKDTLTIGWNAAIPGAIWTDNNGKVKKPTGGLSWTPGEQHASPIPYVFTVTVKDDACPVNGSSTRAYQILVKPLPRANITEVDSGCGNYWLFAKAILGSSPSYSWMGYFNPTKIVNGRVMQHKFKKPGKYPYSMTIEARDCSRTYHDTIEVDTFIYLDEILDRHVCYGDSVTIGAMYNYNSGDVTFEWNTSSQDTVQYKSLKVTQDTTIMVKVTDTMGCSDRDSSVIDMHYQPVVDAGPDIRLCSYSNATIDPGVTYDSADFGSAYWEDGSGSTLSPNLNITVSDSGRYYVYVTDTFGCLGMDTVDVVVSPQMIAQAAGTTICYGEEAELEAAETGSKTANVQYRWYDGSTLAATGRKVSMTPKSDKNYKLVVVEEIDGVACRDSTIVPVKVNPLPDITINTIDEKCESGINSDMISLNDFVVVNPATSTKSWSSPSYGLLPVYPGDKFNPIIAGPGSHKVVLTATNPVTGCVNKDSSYVTINPLPAVDAGIDDTVCTGDGSVPLTGTPLSPPGMWSSISGKGVEGTLGTQEFNPTAAGISDGGTYYLVYTYSDNEGCENSDTMRMTVYETPNTDAGTYDDLCIYESEIAMKGTPGGGKWTGPGLTNFGTTFNPSVAGVGVHELTYTVNNVVCKVTDKTKITVNPRPTLSVNTASGEKTFCSNTGFVQLVGQPKGGSWSGTSVTGSFFNTRVLTSDDPETSYDLEYYYKDNNGCENTKDMVLTVRPEPVILIDTTKPSLCYPEDYSGELTYRNADGVEWYYKAGEAFGTFTSATDQASVTYRPALTDLNNLSFMLRAKTTHSDNVCAAVFDSVEVIMSDLPDAKFTFDPKEGCVPFTVNFYDSSTINAGTVTGWKWDFGDGTKSSAQNPAHEFTEARPYSVKLTAVSNADCERSAYGTVTGRIVPEAGFIPNPEVATQSAANIEFENRTGNETPGIGYEWQMYRMDYSIPDSSLIHTSTDRDPEHRFVDTGYYNVYLYAENEWGCKDTSVREVIIKPDVIAFIPSAFSPDGLGVELNDTFKVVVDGIAEFELKVYSRWGELLYESYDYDSHGWDGTYLNSDAKVPVGAYVYILKLKGKDGADYKYSGTVTLVK